jgi:hypothetical protein
MTVDGDVELNRMSTAGGKVNFRQQPLSVAVPRQ